jgi:hypothetical protein
MPRGELGAAAAALIAVLLGGCGAKRLYEGPALPASQVAVIHVGRTIVRGIDGHLRRGGVFDVDRFEVAPGAHSVVLVFEVPEHSIGVKTIPARRGEGRCTIEFVAEAGKQYWLASRPAGTGWPGPHWNGKWEAWVRDPSIGAEDDILARCSSQPSEPEEKPRPETAAAVPPVAPTPRAVGAAAPPPAPIPNAVEPVGGDRFIRLGTWHIRRLGGDPAKDYALLAGAIERNFDIIALTGVVASAGGSPGYDRLKAALGGEWNGLVTAPPRSRNGEPEGYAVLYRTARVRPCAGWSDLRPAGLRPGIFAREPAFGCFEAGAIEFLLAAYRATWADGDAAAVASEVAHLDEVFAAMAAARPGEKDLVVAGDLNLRPAELPLATAAVDRTRGTGSTLDLRGERSADLYDHVLVPSVGAVPEMVGDAEVLDVRALADSPRDFRRTASDHLPIMVRLRFTGPDGDVTGDR